jgi:hypothetical protein
MGVALLNFNNDPFIQKEHAFHGFINEDSDYILDIEFTSLNGLMPHLGIRPTIMVTLPEINGNTTSIQVVFPKGAVMNTDAGIPREGNPIQLKYLSTGSNISVYTGEAYLMYYFEGNYGAEIKIISETEPQIEDKIDEVIHIGSWENYVSQIRQNNSDRLSWIIAGFALIATASTFSKLLDWGYNYKILKKKVFYE